MKKFLLKIMSGLVALSMLAGTAFGDVNTAPDAVDEDTDNSQQTVFPEDSESMVFLQDDMRAVFLTPEKDFTEENIDKVCSEIIDYGMNAVIIASASEEKDYYDLGLDESGIIEKAIEEAHKAGLSAYVTIDVNSLLDQVIEQGGGLKEGFSAAAHKFVIKYACDGIILTDYYTQNSAETFSVYLDSGSGIGYEKWLYEINEYMFRTVCEVIHKTNNTVAAGVMIEDMWANKSQNEDGSSTNDTITALYDGNCNTKKYIESGLVDLVMVKAYGSDENTALNFEKVVSWWYDVAEKSGVKMYVYHFNDRIGTKWNEDQLLRQLTIMDKKFDKLGGSAFNSLSALRKNVLNSTETLKMYFNNQINPDTLFEELEMVSPKQLTYVTYNASEKFMGTFDENFDVYFDGVKIKLNEAGNFYIQKDLEVGKNKFTIEHKGKKIVYNIERRVVVLKSIENTGDVVVEGGTRIALVAIAYSGSSVSAIINGQVINLTEKGKSDQIDANGDYSEFVGYYTVGEGIIGKEQNLGSISFHASYKGYEARMDGGTVTIQAKPEPPREDFKSELIPDQSSAGTGEVVGTIDPIVKSDSYVKYVRIENNDCEIFDAKTTGRIPTPLLFRQPAGTIDYYRSSSDGYVITDSGRRYNAGDVYTFESTGIGYNALVVNEIGNSGGKSFITFGLDYKISFNIVTSQTLVSAAAGPYGVNTFNAEYIYITFDNVTSVTALPDFSGCSLFSGGEWEIVEENSIPKFRLKLMLRQAGIYSGAVTKYDENGMLRIEFPVPTPSLAGKTIVISPGHGYTAANKFDPGAIGGVTEQSVNLAMSFALAEKLEALGANVVRLPTESTVYAWKNRPIEAKKYNADMFLELHCNSFSSTTAHGVEAYYFTPWSEPLAEYITNNLSNFFDSHYADGTKSNRKEKYDYFIVTLEQSFPSVLVEMGFISNERECLTMANAENQKKMADAIAQGIVEYFARCRY
ncbi:MAG: N-acetylmuramoyl-L-alanine amidase [Oscillospiraceae bacterium]|nr:N-acetylmuramoyl-L-alanine amidase [Oscillospiraceae bacterium]